MPQSFESKLELTNALLRILPESPEFQWEQAELAAKQAQSFAVQENWEEAFELARKSIRQKEEIVRRFPDHELRKLALGKSFAPLAIFYEKSGNFDEAAALFRRGIDILQSMESNLVLAEEVAIALQSLYHQMSNHMLQRILAFRTPDKPTD